jgi:hypothetical protein
VQVERAQVERRALLVQRRVRAPDSERRADLEQRGAARVRVRGALLARDADGEGREFTRDGVVGWLRAEEIVDDRPGGAGPAIVDLRGASRGSAWDGQGGKSRGACLPDEGAGGVLAAGSFPVAPPEAVCGRKRLGLHDLRIVHVAERTV